MYRTKFSEVNSLSRTEAVMESGSNFNSQFPETQNQSQLQRTFIAQSLYRMRCPRCQKLYSVEAQVLREATEPLKFQCVECECKFAAAPSPMDLAGAGLESIQTYEIFSEPQASLIENHMPDFIEETDQVGEGGAGGATDPNLQFRQPIERVPTTTTEARCPKCGTRNALTSTECRSCGIVFAKFKPEGLDSIGVPTIMFPRQRALAEMWESLLADYENLELHDIFIQTCLEGNTLPFASQKYGRILSATPNEEIAKTMRKRIIALASYRSEVAVEKGKWSFRVPAFNNVILFMGGALMVMGFMIPAMKSLAGVGFAAIALAFGVRYFLRPPV